MTDNLKLRGSPDNKRINVHEPYEVRSWAQHFGVTPERLKQAVAAAGTSAAAVRRYLGK